MSGKKRSRNTTTTTTTNDNETSLINYLNIINNNNNITRDKLNSYAINLETCENILKDCLSLNIIDNQIKRIRLNYLRTKRIKLNV